MAQVLQALSKIVPILSLLPVALVQSIVGYTGAAVRCVVLRLTSGGPRGYQG